MITDAFFRRYEDVKIFGAYNERERRFLAQAAQIITEELFVRDLLRYKEEKNDPANRGQEEAHKRIAREIGVSWLASPTWVYKWDGPQGQKFSRTINRKIANRTSIFLSEAMKETSSPDLFIKFRISFIEVAFQARANQLERQRASLAVLFGPDSSNQAVALANALRQGSLAEKENSRIATEEANFTQCVDELNERFRQAKMPLSYHNGFIQMSSDELLETQVERAFWSLVSQSKWANVDNLMKEAFDKRDRSERDAVTPAMQALESVIKIISDDKGWTTGDEKGAVHYINHLVAERNGNRYVEVWEKDALISLFGNIRNNFGHGPGSKPLPRLSSQQTEWAIDIAMVWIKSLVARP